MKNRDIITDKNGEYIKTDGGKTPSENLRLGTFDSNIYNTTKDIRKPVTLFPELVSPYLTLLFEKC